MTVVGWLALARGALVAAGRRFLGDDGLVLAAALSFAFLLCLAPLILILFSVAGFLLESDEIAEYLFDSVALVLPAYTHEAAEFLGVLAKERAVTGLVGAAGLAVFASQLFGMVRRVANRAFGIPAPRGFLHGLAFDLAAVVTVGSAALGVAVAVVLLVALRDLALWLVPLPLPASLLVRRMVSLPIMYATGVVLLFIVYRTFPNTRVPARAAAIATLAVTVVLETGRWGFVAYIAWFGVYGKLYGSFGIGVAALVWIYFSATVFVLGAELAAVLADR